MATILEAIDSYTCSAMVTPTMRCTKGPHPMTDNHSSVGAWVALVEAVQPDALGRVIHDAMCDWSAHLGLPDDHPHFDKWRSIGRHVSANLGRKVRG